MWRLGGQAAKMSIRSLRSYLIPKVTFHNILYFYFRIYKKQLLWSFMQSALSSLHLKSSDTLYFTDVGAALGHDALYLVRKLTNNFRQPLPFAEWRCSLIEGAKRNTEVGEETLRLSIKSPAVKFQYFRQPLVEGIPLPDDSQNIVLCSEVLEHLEDPEKVLREIFRILEPGGFLLFTTDNSPSLLQRIRRIPVWLSGKYDQVYYRPIPEKEISEVTEWRGREYPIYGHINLNPTRHWEKLCKNVGFKLVSYGTYQSIRRGGGSKSPFALSLYFAFGALVYHLLPRNVGRFFGDTTASCCASEFRAVFWQSQLASLHLLAACDNSPRIRNQSTFAEALILKRRNLPLCKHTY